MLAASAWVLSAAVVAGLVLVVLSQVAPRAARVWWPGAVHGVLALAGLALLLLGLGGPARGVAEGAGSFGVVAAWFVGVAALLGAVVFVARMRGRPPSMLVVGVHATVGVGGLVMLAAYLSV